MQEATPKLKKRDIERKKERKKELKKKRNKKRKQGEKIETWKKFYASKQNFSPTRKSKQQSCKNPIDTIKIFKIFYHVATRRCNLPQKKDITRPFHSIPEKAAEAGDDPINRIAVIIVARKQQNPLAIRGYNIAPVLYAVIIPNYVACLVSVDPRRHQKLRDGPGCCRAEHACYLIQ